MDIHELLAAPARRHRFESGVDAGAQDACWPWLRAKNSSGYGVLRIGSLGISHTVMAHRAAWMLSHAQPIPEGMVIDHGCRNRACCNPAHLTLVTQTENVRRSDWYRAGDGAVVRCGPATVRPRGHRFMVIWREYLDSGSTRQRGRTFDTAPEAAMWADSLVVMSTAQPS